MTQHTLARSFRKMSTSFKWAFFDIDGVLTDGTLYYGASGEIFKAFNVKDGHGIQLLKSAGIRLCAISGKGDAAVANRLEHLQFDEYIFQRSDKGAAFEELKFKYGGVLNESFCIGDDLPDLQLFEKVRMSFAPSDAVDPVKRAADHVLEKAGGKGAVREMCELILGIK